MSASLVMIEPATAAHEALAERVMPRAFRPVMPVEPFVLRSASDGVLVGFAVVSSLPARSDPAGPGLAWAVRTDLEIEPDALEGDVVSGLEAIAWRSGADAVYSLASMPGQGPEEARWVALGFEAQPDRERFRVKIQDVFEHADRLLERARRRLPAGLEVVRASEIDLERLVPLQAEAFGGDATQARAMVVGHSGFTLVETCTPVAVLEGRPVGYLYVGVDQRGRLVVPLVAVGGSLRGTAAEAVLLRWSTRWALDEGREIVEFEAGPQHGMTRRVASRVGGAIVESNVFMRKCLSVADGTD